MNPAPKPKNENEKARSRETRPESKTRRKPPPPWLLNTLTALVGLATLGLGVGWLVYSWVVDLEIPYFAIPLVLCVPVIVAVAFRNIWD